MIEILALLLTAATLGVLVWVARSDANLFL
jgi:hypothetical protein